MTKLSPEILFSREVDKKYQVLNSLFMSLPYEKMQNIGSLLPFLYALSEQRFQEGKTPEEIMDEFFAKHTYIQSEDQRNDLIFIMIQYIERQIVLFDSIEDSAFDKLHQHNQKGTINHLYQITKQHKLENKALDKLKDFKVRIVFTAHPTQFYPNSVLRIIHELEEAIKVNDINWIDTLLQQLGKTPFINKNKPTPLDEAMSIIYYLRNVYYDAIGEMHDNLFSQFEMTQEEFVPVLELGFWPGGDRDGNPFVNAEITKAVSNELRFAILKSYYKHLKELGNRLTFEDVSEKLEHLTNEVYVNMFGQKYDLTLEKLNHAVAEIRQELIEKHNGFFIHYLDRFIRRIKMFGLHFASLDIRQDSSKHLSLMQDIVSRNFGNSKPYEEMSEGEKVDFLMNTQINLNAEDYEDPIHSDTITNIKQLKSIQDLNGEKACHRYIISNSTSIIQVLEVYALFKWCGYSDEDINFDIIPLFETVEGMNNAPEVMDRLYKMDVYKAHLERRNKRQTIMLGFSDGTKDGGYVKANWGINRTKENLTTVSKENGFDVIFFDGRGGPPARGGGKTHQFYAAQGKTIANNEIHLTIQGQTITSVYGSKEQAIYNFEQLISAGILNDILEEESAQLSQEQKDLIDRLAEISYAKYQSLKDHEKFVPYLEKMSTLKFYGKTNIGSRPSKRGNQKGIQFESLRAIPFVGSWSQLKQNVPGYYGFGTALKQLMDEGKTEELKKLYNESLFFKTLMQNSMMSMSKTFFPLTGYMENNEEFGEFWKMLKEEFTISKSTMLELTGYQSLMEDTPLSSMSVQYRERIVLPLLTIQQYALSKLANLEDEDLRPIYEKMVIRSLFGNINASRNSA